MQLSGSAISCPKRKNRLVTSTRTLFGKVRKWHVASDLGQDLSLIYTDRHLLHDLSGARALDIAGQGVTVLDGVE